MFNPSSYSTTLMNSVIYSHFDQPSVDGYSASTSHSHWCWIGTSRGFVMISHRLRGPHTRLSKLRIGLTRFALASQSSSLSRFRILRSNSTAFAGFAGSAGFLRFALASKIILWLRTGFAFVSHWLHIGYIAFGGFALAFHWLRRLTIDFVLVLQWLRICPALASHWHSIGFTLEFIWAPHWLYRLCRLWRLFIGFVLASHWYHIGFILEFRWALHWLFRLCRLWRLFIDFVLASHWYHIGFTLAALALQWLRIGSAMAPHWLCNGFALAPQWLRKALTFGEYSVNCARGMTVTLFEGSYLLLPFNGSFYAVTLLKASYLRWPVYAAWQ